MRVCLLALQLLSVPALRPPLLRCRRSPTITLSASGTTDDEPPLTMGDLLASVAQSQQDQLDASTLQESDQRSLDAMVEFGSDELMRTAMKLQGELSAVERNTSALLSERLGDAEREAMRALDKSAADMRRTAATERLSIEVMQARITELTEERRQITGRQRRGAASRKGGVVSRAAEYSASATGLLILLALLDAAAGVALGEAPLGLARLLTGSSRAGGGLAAVGVAQVVWGTSLAGAGTVYTLSMTKLLLSSDKFNQNQGNSEQNILVLY